MKKLTSLLLAGMITVSGCTFAVSASAAGEESSNKAIIHLGDSQTNAKVGDIVEVTVKGTSAVEGVSGVAALNASIYFNQQSADSREDYSTLDVLGYSTAYYEGGAYYAAGNFPGAMFMVRPESEAEFDRDNFNCVVASGNNTGDFTEGQDIVKLTLEVKNPGECYVATKLNEVVYMEEGKDIPTSNINALTIDTAIQVVKSTGEDPTDPSEPSEPSDPSEPSAPTEPSDPSEPSEPSEPTDPSKPSEKPTVPSEPSEPSNPSEKPSDAPTNATTIATSTSTSVVVSGTTTKVGTTNGGVSTTTGKVATGDSAAVAVLLAVLTASAGAVVFARRRSAR